MRKHTVNILTSLTPGDKQVTDKEIVEWANGKVSGAGKATSIRNFQDSSIGNGKFLLDLCASVAPLAVDPAIITAGNSPDEKLSNARYR